MDFTDFEYHKDKVPSEHKANEKFFMNLEDKFSEEIKSSPKAAEFFKNYDPNSINSFINMYAGRKGHLAKYYYFYDEMEHRREFKFREMTEQVFEAIKQKKLFNLQLQWRAELITIKEINFSYDFEFWGNHIDDCPFLPEIIPEEIEIMKQYLRSQEDAFNQIHWVYNWQDYHEFIQNKENEDEETLPEWYQFYDTRMGTRQLMLLPNIRGKKEEYYEDMGREEIHRQREENNKKNPPPTYTPPLPYLWSDYKKILEFSKIYEEDKHFLRLFEIYHEEHTRNESKDEENRLVEEAIDLLKEADIPVYMTGGMEWRKAIIHCAEKYKHEMIIDELDALYSEYCMFKDLGISRGKTREELNEEYEKDTLVKIIREFIFKGRELCGEPQDFNF